MTLPKSPYETTIPESWQWTIDDFERQLSRPHGRHLGPLITLTRQIAVTRYGQSYRAGQSLRTALLISTAAQHGLGPDEPCVIVRADPSSSGFHIEYHKGGDVTELVKSYGTDDRAVIEANLRRDMIDRYACGQAEAWETIQPLLVRLWNETHSRGVA